MCAPWDEAVVLQLPDGFGCGPVSAGVLGGVLIFIEQSIASITRGAGLRWSFYASRITGRNASPLTTTPSTPHLNLGVPVSRWSISLLKPF